MKYDLSINRDLKNAEFYFSKLVNSKSKVEITKIVNKRTSQQNRALHKFFEIISSQLNEIGLEFKYFGLKGQIIELMYTPNIVKEQVWKPIQLALFDIESTTKINTEQINKIIDILTKFFSERGVVIEFPSIDTLMKSYDN